MATLLDWARTLSASPLYLAATVLCLIASLVAIAFWGYLWRLIRRGFPVRCWFCSGTTRVPYGNRNCFDCPHCDQYNGFDRDGGYNKDIPAMRHSAMNVQRSSSSSQVAATGGSSSAAVLCATCNHNQALKVAQLAQFEPSSPAAEDAELAALRARLERAYALCQRCRAARRAALQSQDIRLLPGLLAWQRSRVLAQQRRGRPFAAAGADAAGCRWLLRSGAVSLAAMGAAAVASAEAARLVCAPAVACLAGGLWLRHRGRGGGRLSVRACDLWHGPVFFAAVEPLRSRLTAWLAELFTVHLGVSSSSPAWSWVPTARPSSWLFAALLATLHAVAFVLNWRLSASSSRSVVSAVAGGSKGGFRSLNSVTNNSNNNNNSRHSNSSTCSNASNNNTSFGGANSDLPQPPTSQAQGHYDEDNFESASVLDYNRRQVMGHQRQEHQQQQQQQLASAFQRRPLFASHAASASGLIFFNSGGGGGNKSGRPASLPPTLVGAWPPQRASSSASLFHQHHQHQLVPPPLPPPPPPCTPVDFQRQRPRSRSRSPSRHQQLQPQFLPLAPSPMDVDDEMAAFANGGGGRVDGGVAGDINGGGGDSAYASQRGSVADLPTAFVAAHGGDGGSTATAAAAAAAAAAPRSRLSQVLIGCCLGLNFSLLLHCLLLPAARAALAANGLGAVGAWETLLGAWIHG